MPKVESCRFYPEERDLPTQTHEQLRWVAAVQNGAFVDVSLQRSARSTQHDDDTYGMEISLTPDAALQLARDLQSVAAQTAKFNAAATTKEK